MTPQFCQNGCNEMGYSLSGVENGNSGYLNPIEEAFALGLIRSFLQRASAQTLSRAGNGCQIPNATDPVPVTPLSLADRSQRSKCTIPRPRPGASKMLKRNIPPTI